MSGVAIGYCGVLASHAVRNAGGKNTLTTLRSVVHSYNSKKDEVWYKTYSSQLPIEYALTEVSFVPNPNVFELGDVPTATIVLRNNGTTNEFKYQVVTFEYTFSPGNFSSGGGILDIDFTMGSDAGTAIPWFDGTIDFTIDPQQSIRLIGNVITSPLIPLPMEDGSSSGRWRMVKFMVRQLLYAVADIDIMKFRIKCVFNINLKSVPFIHTNMQCRVIRSKTTFNPSSEPIGMQGPHIISERLAQIGSENGSNPDWFWVEN